MSFSFARFYAVLLKELRQMRRDPATIALIIALPLVQLLLFGFAINLNPHNLPAGLLSADHSRYERDIVTALTNTGYFQIQTMASEAEADRALARGEVLLVVNLPANFSRQVDRGERPALLLDADATDPVAISNAVSALNAISSTVLTRDLPGNVRSGQTPFEIRVHARYNPSQITAINIVPGLICIVLSFSTLISMTLSISREREQGTMENLLALPARPAEIIAGKILPYVILGYLQVAVMLVASLSLLGVPLSGSLPLLLAALGLFMASNLALGLTISSTARTQMQAEQMAQFALLPAFLLSGFLFPFQGMPGWAKVIGEALPLTHAVRIVRALMLKGVGGADIFGELWPIALFTLVVGVIAVRTYRETLD